MSVEIEYYLSCDTCSEVYRVKSDDPQDVVDQAIDDGWGEKLEGDDINSDTTTNVHTCPDCLEKTK